jgi:hypothetical protein
METVAEVVVILSSIAFSVALAGIAINAVFGAVHTNHARELRSADASAPQSGIGQQR